MGWVSCLEDIQESLDDWINTVQGLSTGIDGSVPYGMSRMRQELHDLQSQLDKLVEVVTDPEISPKIELPELKEAYGKKERQNQQLQSELSEQQKQSGEQLKEIEELSRQLTEMAKSLKTERDLAEHATAKYYEEQQRRERIESELQGLKKVRQDGNNLTQKKHSRER